MTDIDLIERNWTDEEITALLTRHLARVGRPLDCALAIVEVFLERFHDDGDALTELMEAMG